MSDILSQISERRQTLAHARAELKSYFVGIDGTIDQIIDAISAWYIMPEAVTRPVTVNLWGMTGVGKTDLVRKLVKLLGMNSSYLELQLSNKGADNLSGWISSLADALGDSNIEEGKPGILLLDEIQRFRTVKTTVHGQEDVPDVRFQDLWMLLSDGKFSSSAKYADILEILYSKYRYHSDPDFVEEEESSEGPTVTKKKKKNENKKYFQSLYEARKMKSVLRLLEPIDEIMKWSDEKKIEVAQKKLKDDSTYDNEDRTKMLIFISGNLDEAYSMAKDIANADCDADVVYEESKKINVIDIKKALAERFKPEQISRLGNTHIIYPALNKASFRKIIAKRISAIFAAAKQAHGVSITCDKSIDRFLYRNGVFPTQGVRPVLSTINAFLDNSIPEIVIFAMENGISEVSLSVKKNKLIVTASKSTLKIPWIGSLDAIKQKRTHNEIALCAVHEAGHALAYAILSGRAPKEIVVGALGNPFVRTNEFKYIFSKDKIMDKIKVCLAGRAAEIIVFGEDSVTGGSITDIESATYYARMSVLKLGMDDLFVRVETNSSDALGHFARGDEIEICSKLDEILKSEMKQVERLLSSNKDNLLILAKRLMSVKKMDEGQAMAFFKSIGIMVEEEDGDEGILDFSGMFAKQCLPKVITIPKVTQE